MRREWHDSVKSGAQLPDGEDLEALLNAEELAGANDPYRWFGALLHVVAVRQT